MEGEEGNRSWELEYPSLEVVEPRLQRGLVALFSLTAGLSLVANSTVLLVLTCTPNRSGRDLRVFLISLAISDVAMAVFSIPFTYTMFMLGRWIFQPWFCPVVLLMQHVSVLTSVYTLIAIGIDRYRAILHPLSAKTKRPAPKLVVGSIWASSFAVSSVQLFISRASKFKYDGEWHYDCSEAWDSEAGAQGYTLFVFGISFLVPVVGLAATYGALARRLWSSAAPGNAHPSRDLAHLRAKCKVIKMLVVIVVLFALCWLPLQTFLLLYYFIPEFGYFPNDVDRRIYALSYFACLWLANANSCINPLVYSFMSDNFRADVRDILRRLRGCTKVRSFNHSTLYKEPLTYTRRERVTSSQIEDSRVETEFRDTRVASCPEDL